jgi:hypothetical protein
MKLSRRSQPDLFQTTLRKPVPSQQATEAVILLKSLLIEAASGLIVVANADISTPIQADIVVPEERASNDQNNF